MLRPCRAFLPFLAALAALPSCASALEVQSRTSVVSGLPLVLDPAPASALFLLDWQERVDGSPIAMTLSDGGRWRGDPARLRGEVTAGLGIWRLVGALQVGADTAGLAAQVDLVRGEGWKVATTATGRVGAGGGWDLALVPAWSARIPVFQGWQGLAFAGARVRWGQSLYEVQGWSADRSTPFASALTRDLALAPLGGVAVVRWVVEVRVTLGWEVFLVDHVDWEARPTQLHRAGGPFGAAMLRFRVPRVP